MDLYVMCSAQCMQCMEVSRVAYCILQGMDMASGIQLRSTQDTHTTTTHIHHHPSLPPPHGDQCEKTARPDRPYLATFHSFHFFWKDNTRPGVSSSKGRADQVAEIGRTEINQGGNNARGYFGSTTCGSVCHYSTLLPQRPYHSTLRRTGAAPFPALLFSIAGCFIMEATDGPAR